MTAAAASGLVDRTARAASWRLAASIVAAASQLVVGIILARLLPPAEFGVMALATVLIGFVRPIADLGLGNALVQRPRIDHRHIRVSFTAAVMCGAALTAIVAAAAPLAGMLARQALVAAVGRLLAVLFLIRGCGVVAEALLRRRLDFRRLFFIEAGSYAVGYGIVAIVLALSGYGVWSLAWGAIVQAATATLAQGLAVRHDVRPLFARTELVELLRFGAGASAASWVNYLALNGDNFVVGRVLGTAALGLYGRAYALMDLPHAYISGVVAGVLFPAFAQVQNDAVRLQRGYLLMTRATAIVAGPALAILAVTAPHLVASVYGPRWSGVVLPLQILCVAGYFRALYHLGGVIVQSVGQVYGELVRQAIYAGLVLAGAFVGARVGLPWVAVAVGGAIVFMYVATATAALRASGTGWRCYLAAQRPAALTTAATLIVAIGARLLIERWTSSSVAIVVVVAAVAALPWAAGALHELADPAYEPLRGVLPAGPLRFVAALRPLTSSPVSPRSL